jgi:hypothetical protein
MFVLDVLADDIESLEGILDSLNRTASGWREARGAEFRRSEVVEALSRLIAADLVRTYTLDEAGAALAELPATSLPPRTYDDAWYALTERGRMVHANWSPEPNR